MSDFLRNYRAGHFSEAGVGGITTPHFRTGALARLTGDVPGDTLGVGFEASGRRSLGQIALRGVTGILEPIQLPKDILDAVVVGAMDPNSSIMDRLSRIEWAKYAPYGAEPSRPATGREFAEFAGIQNDTLKKAVGFAWDVVADPLLAGGLISGAGRVAAASGAAALGSRLMQAGRAIDTALSPAAGFRAAGRVIRSAPGGDWLASRSGMVLNSILDAKAWGQRGPEARTWGDLFLPPSQALARQMPREVPASLNVPGRVSMGRSLYNSERRGQQYGREAELQIMSLLQDAHTTLLGRDAVPLLRRFSYDMGRAIRRMNKVELESLPVALRDTILREGFAYVDNVGLATRPSLRADAPRELHELLQDMAGAAPTTGPIASYQRDLLTHARNTVRQVARQTGFKNPDEAVRRFDYLRERIQEADALAGYYASGYPIIQERWVRNAVEAGFDAPTALSWWREIGQRTMAGETLPNIKTLGGQDISTLFPNLRAQVPGTDAPRMVETVGDLVSPMNRVDIIDPATGAVKQMDGFFGLDLGAFFYNLQHGHLRRVYGVFNHPDDFQGYMKMLQEGKLIPNNVLYSQNVRGILNVTNPRAADVLDNYLRTVESTGLGPVMNPAQQAAMEAAKRVGQGQDRLQRGLMVRQDDLARVLKENGFKPGEIREVLGELITGLKANPHWQAAVENAHVLIRDYERTRGLTQAAGSGGTTVWGSRNRELETKMLTAMGELADPFPSLTASARDVRLRVPQAQMFTEVYEDALKSGYLIDDPTRMHWDPDTGTRFVTMPNDPSIWGGFAGKPVHPFLRKELERVLRARTENRGNALSRLRSLITGGYLASPNVIAANIFGGIYTTAMAGEGPLSFIPELVTSFMEFHRASRTPGYHYMALDDLKRHTDVDATTIVSANVKKGMDHLRGIANAQDPDDLRRVSRGITQWLQSQLDAPLGQKWAGLDGFQFTENWMKVSAFQARRKTLALMEGVPLSEFKKPWADRTQAARLIDAQAAEFARTSVFDYSDLPGLLDGLRNLGVMLFPGFQYFIVGRTLDTMMNRPGLLASADRISGAIADLVLDEDTKLALYASMPEWLMEDHGIPLPFMSYTHPSGERRHTVIPFNQLLPTNPLTDTPLIESLSSGGIYRPLFEMLYANVEGSGAAPFSERFGQRVFSEGAPLAERLGQSLAYMVTNLMPGLLRKVGGSYHPDYGFQGGILSEQAAQSLAKNVSTHLFQSGLPVAPGMQEWLYSWREIQTRRADRRFGDYVVSTLLRSPQVVTTGGGLTSSVRRVVESSKREKDAEVRRLRRLADIARRAGNQQSMLGYFHRIAEIERDWAFEAAERYQLAAGGGAPVRASVPQGGVR